MKQPFHTSYNNEKWVDKNFNNEVFPPLKLKPYWYSFVSLRISPQKSGITIASSFTHIYNKSVPHEKTFFQKVIMKIRVSAVERVYTEKITVCFAKRNQNCHLSTYLRNTNTGTITTFYYTGRTKQSSFLPQSSPAWHGRTWWFLCRRICSWQGASSCRLVISMLK